MVGLAMRSTCRAGCLDVQAMEGAMIGLQEAQVESMRRLTAGLTDAIGEAQLTLQVRAS